MAEFPRFLTVEGHGAVSVEVRHGEAAVRAY
jgi:hypothetical protein